MSVSLILFLVVAIIAVATALGMLFSRNAVYAALFLVLELCHGGDLVPAAGRAVHCACPGDRLCRRDYGACSCSSSCCWAPNQSGRPLGNNNPWWFQPVPLFLGGVLLAETVVILVTQFAG